MKKGTLAAAAVAAVALQSDAKLKSFGVGDYVQSGLVAHFDGICNAGADLPHSDAAERWIDLAADGVYASRVDIPASGDYDRGGWTEKGYRFAGWSIMEMSAPLTLGEEFTIQFAGDVDCSHYEDLSVDHDYPNLFSSEAFQYTNDSGASKTANLALYLNRSYPAAIAATNLLFDTIAYNLDHTSTYRPTIVWEDGRYASAEFNRGTEYAYASVTAGVTWPTAASDRAIRRNKPDASVQELTYAIGGRNDKTAQYCMRGVVNSVRIYSRQLSNAELAWNRALDEYRFHGGPEPARSVTNVVVAASGYAGVSGAEAAGVYEVDGSHVFTAPDVTVGDVTYSASGYTLEAWTGSCWGTARAFGGNSYEYVVADGSPAVRLTWLWKPARGIRSAADYDAGDYVQGGLVAQYDGIRNAGAGLPHDPAAEVWKDLKSDNYMTFNGTTDVAAATGSWSGGNAYRFAGYSYARMAEAITLGSNITVQLAVDIDNAAQIEAAGQKEKAMTPTYMSAQTDCGFFTRPKTPSQTTYVQWKSDSWTGGSALGRPNMNNWKCKYLTGIAADEKVYVTQGTTYANEFTRTKFSSFANLRWTVGGAHYDASSTSDENIDLRCTRGLYHSARFYSRALSEEELEWNRKVDEVRFRGVVYTNVVVATPRPGVEGVQPSGVYEVLTEGVFRAEPVPSFRDGHAVTYVPTGYTIERLSGSSWGTPEAHGGDSYVHSTSAETGIVRLTWKWRTDGIGLRVIIR